MYIHIAGEYTQERYVWYDYEDDCDDWYMESYNMEIIGHRIMKEYNQETYAWFYWFHPQLYTINYLS